MQMDVEIQARAESLHECDRTGVHAPRDSGSLREYEPGVLVQLTRGSQRWILRAHSSMSRKAVPASSYPGSQTGGATAVTGAGSLLHAKPTSNEA